MSAPFFIDERVPLDADSIGLSGSEGRHAAVVKRVRRGERVDVTNGNGFVAECVVTAVGRDGVDCQVIRRYEVSPPQPRLVVVQALAKGDRGEDAVEMMTEIGVDAIVPWAAARCVAVWRPERVVRALDRWRSTAREAAKQSRRPHLPVVAEPATTEQVTMLLERAATGLVLHESATTSLASVEMPRHGDIVVVVGPEGGITDAEIAGFRAAEATPVRLGPTVLRTSTAGVAAGALLLARCGRW